MIQTLILILISYILISCDLIHKKTDSINKKINHDILLKLEKDLIHYNTQTKEEQIVYEKKKAIACT